MKPERVLARQVDTSDKPMISRRDVEALMERDLQPRPDLKKWEASAQFYISEQRTKWHGPHP